MLQPVVTRVNGMLFITGTSFFVPSVAVRPTARQLRDRRNAVYAEATRSGDPDLGIRMVNAHVAAEDYTIRVCEAVLNDRLAKVQLPTCERCGAAMALPWNPLSNATYDCGMHGPANTEAAKAPRKPRKARKATPVAHSTECADICICGSQR